MSSFQQKYDTCKQTGKYKPCTGKISRQQKLPMTSNKDFKVTIINIFYELKDTIIKGMMTMSHQIKTSSKEIKIMRGAKQE